MTDEHEHSHEHEHSLTDNEKPASNTKVAIQTALITAAATILASALADFIGILPRLRQTDQKTIQVYQQRIEKLQTQLNKKSANYPYTVKGSVKYKKGNAPMKDAVLAAARAEDSVALDDGGAFYLSNVANQFYSVTLVNPQDGQIWRVMLDPSLTETDTGDLTITYQFSPPPTTQASAK